MVDDDGVATPRIKLDLVVLNGSQVSRGGRKCRRDRGRSAIGDALDLGRLGRGCQRCCRTIPEVQRVRCGQRGIVKNEEKPIFGDHRRLKGAPLRLIDDFSSFYVNRIALFNHSVHILDMEKQIREKLESMGLSRDGVPATNFTFVDSKTEPGIQIADIVVGLLGKLHSYFTQTRLQDVASLRASLSGISLANVELLRDCISQSNDANTAFLNHVMSSHDFPKLDCFLRFTDGAFV